MWHLINETNKTNYFTQIIWKIKNNVNIVLLNDLGNSSLLPLVDGFFGQKSLSIAIVIDDPLLWCNQSVNLSQQLNKWNGSFYSKTSKKQKSNSTNGWDFR